MGHESQGGISSERVARMERLRAASEQIAGIPLTPSPRWCERVCTALARSLGPDAAAMALTGLIDDAGRVEQRELSGVHASVAPRPAMAPAMSPSAGATLEPPELSGSAPPPGLHTHLRAVRSLGVRLSGRRPVVMALDACAPAPMSLAGLALSWGAMPTWNAAMAVWDLGQRQLAVVLRGGAPVEAAEMLWVLMPGIARRGAAALGARVLRRRHLLTPLEEHVLDLLAVGLAVPEIAAQLSRSRHTVHDHVKSLHRKIGVNSRAELVARATGRIPAGLLDGAEPRLGAGLVLGGSQDGP